MSRDEKIKQLAELHVMLSLGEVSFENFAKAFHYRFRKEIQSVKDRRHKQSNYGWDDIDWQKFESSPNSLMTTSKKIIGWLPLKRKNHKPERFVHEYSRPYFMLYESKRDAHKNTNSDLHEIVKCTITYEI